MVNGIESFDSTLNDNGVVTTDELNGLAGLTLEDWRGIAKAHPRNNSNGLWVEETPSTVVIHNDEKRVSSLINEREGKITTGKLVISAVTGTIGALLGAGNAYSFKMRKPSLWALGQGVVFAGIGWLAGSQRIEPNDRREMLALKENPLVLDKTQLPRVNETIVDLGKSPNLVSFSELSSKPLPSDRTRGVMRESVRIADRLENRLPLQRTDLTSMEQSTSPNNLSRFGFLPQELKSKKSLRELI